MINNRQQNGRRRGRGGNNGGGNGPRQGGQGRPDNGNRIDSRARGNANQLYEKYKNMASDAQRQGDRINTEYYLQFADHYFRVLADQRGRNEDQQARRQPINDFDLDGDEDYGDEGEPIRAGDQQGEERAERFERQSRDDRYERQPREDRYERQQRDDRPRQAEGDRDDRPRRTDGEQRPMRGWDAGRDSRRDRGDRDPPREVAGQHRSDPPAAGDVLEARADAVLEADAPPPRRGRGRPRREAAVPAPSNDGASAGFEADRLPPSLGIAAANDPDAAPKPRRRRLRTTADEAPTAAE